MKTLKRIKNFLLADDATTAVEYCVMLALILLVLIAGVISAGGGVSQWWADINTDLNATGF